MNIYHIISSIDITFGGPSKSVSDLAYQQSLFNHQIQIITQKSAKPYLKDNPNSNLQLLFSEKNQFDVSIKGVINNSASHLFHGHGLWQKPVHIMARTANNAKKPYIISPRGMLEPWALNKGKIKKKIALALFQREDLAKASCIHATAKMEAENIRKLGFRNPIAVIPNGIDLNDFPLKKFELKEGKKTMLYLSRIHPKKGIDILIDAWYHVPTELKQNWEIKLVGNGEPHYLKFLQKLINKRGLQNTIFITEPQFGSKKLDTYHNADIFVLPTHSENFGIVVAEALACGVPVITTKGTPWEDLISYNCGWWIENTVENLTKTIIQAISTNPSELKVMGENGRKMVEEKYNIQIVAKQMLDLYKWILGDNNKPEFII